VGSLLKVVAKVVRIKEKKDGILRIPTNPVPLASYQLANNLSLQYNLFFYTSRKPGTNAIINICP
jgi:hypothetical protein